MSCLLMFGRQSFESCLTVIIFDRILKVVKTEEKWHYRSLPEELPWFPEAWYALHKGAASSCCIFPIKDLCGLSSPADVRVSR